MTGDVMENPCVCRLQRLRAAMEQENVAAVLIPTADDHNSEYVADHFKAREYYCGFTGSAGTVVVGKKNAALWTDGRYFIQAAEELEGSGVSLMRMGMEGVPTIAEWLKEELSEGEVLSFDGKCLTKKEGKDLEDSLCAEKITVRTDLDLAASCWEDRPALPSSVVFVLDADKYAGETAGSKLARLRIKLKEQGADSFVTGKLDEIMWLLNIRGNDVEYNPVALSYAVITQKQAFLYLQESELSSSVEQYLTEQEVTLRPYESFWTEVPTLSIGSCVWMDPEEASYAVWKCLAAQQEHKILELPSPIGLMKAIRNETEIRNFKSIYIEDSAAITKFIYWLKKSVKEGAALTEGSAAAYLDHLRSEISDYIELSFGTISAYGSNAAMMHYEPDENGGAEILPEGMLLVDSGGQYLRGTTDVTRTMSLGPVTQEMRRSYTLTAVSQLQLMGTVFLKGCNGMSLDIMAREPMWQNGMDYKCGTGHGIGYLLNVHEGPQNIRWKKRNEADTTPFEPGMVISDEPGVYKEGQYGIRIETILLCKEWGKTPDGEFLCFEPLTFAPLDRELLDPEVLTPHTRKLLNEYHQKVLENILPFLNEEEAAWLKEQCREI